MLATKNVTSGSRSRYTGSDDWLEEGHNLADQGSTAWGVVHSQMLPSPYNRDASARIIRHIRHSVERSRVRRHTVIKDVRERLKNANNHFRRKAAEVLGDEEAVLLLANLYRNSNIQLEDFDACRDGIALARLTAANFCEIGARVIYITEAGQGFIESIDQEQ